MWGATRLAIAAMVASATIAAGCGSSDSDEEGIAGPSEVALEEVSSSGDNPFTDPVGRDEDNVKPPKQAQSGGTYDADLPGLYGGTMDYATCDKRQLVSYLQETPDKAKAWADTVSIEPTEIKTYVNKLTPVTLRTDTRVTNHGYTDGIATPIPALLQAGTAVLVDKYGAPVVKCYCGNPLTAPQPLDKPTYTGNPWPTYTPGNVTIIQKTTTIIKVFKLYDLETGEIITRPAGTDGSQDQPAGQPEAPPTQPPTQTPPSQSPDEVEEQPSAYFDPPSGTVGDTYTLHVEGFAPNVTLDVQLTRPDGVTESYSIPTGDAGTGQYTFPQTGGNTPLGMYNAVITNPQTGATATAGTSVSG
jgi:hypothetical protein